ncbi:TRAP transporter substrate-binding protein DctP [Phaeobacter sp. C3_T13_0]|uniref:TRAP transporter substrate-binding protein DctP n=1 Tax=Phaeobacter cretensis TaxID=3342641 RepID=UPI0039BC9060
MKSLRTLGAAALALTASLAPAHAETLVFASTNPAPVPINRFFEQWVEKVNATANGAVEIQLRHGPTLANQVNAYDRVIDGVVDIAWSGSVFNPGKFTNSLAFSIPFFIQTSEQGAQAACAMHENGAFGADYEDLHPLLFGFFGNSALHTVDRELTDGLAGMKDLTIIAPSSSAVEITLGNEATPISVNVTEAYESLQRGAADGMIIPFSAFPAFQLGDVLNHHYAAPLGGMLGAVFMAKSDYEALSDEARAALDAHSTCEDTREFGVFMDEWSNGAMEMARGLEGHTFHEMSQDEIDGIIAGVGGDIRESFEQAFPGGKPLIDEMIMQVEAFK